MSKFLITTSLVMCWAFYELSGGANFEPLEREPVVASPVAEVEEVVVTSTARVEPTPPATDLIVNAAFETIVEEEVVAEPAVEEVVATPTEIVEPDPVPTVYHLVDGDWVNMREGPSTNFAVLDTLPRGTEAEIIDVNDDGWARIRLVANGQEGWMAERLLTEG